MKQHTDYRRRPATTSLLGSGAALLLLPLVSFGWKRERIREVEAEIVPAGEEDPPSIAIVRPGWEQPPAAADRPEEETAERPSPTATSPAEVENEPEPDAGPPPEPATLHEFVAVPSEEPEEHEDEPRTITDPAAPLVSTGDWKCEIALWRDDDQAVFYARAFHNDIEIPLAESPPFPLAAGESPARTPAAVEAHQSLFNELTKDGWVHVESGPEWYGDRFQRGFSVSALNSSLKARLVYTRRP